MMPVWRNLMLRQQKPVADIYSDNNAKIHSIIIYKIFQSDESDDKAIKNFSIFIFIIR